MEQPAATGHPEKESSIPRCSKPHRNVRSDQARKSLESRPGKSPSPSINVQIDHQSQNLCANEEYMCGIETKIKKADSGSKSFSESEKQMTFMEGDNRFSTAELEERLDLI
jgi:hypothetical protein